MSNAPSDSILILNTGKKPKRILWLQTFYLAFPCNILDTNLPTNVTYMSEKKTVKYFDSAFQFQVQRESELKYTLIITRTSEDPSAFYGDFKIHFVCDTNVFDDGSKFIEMRPNKPIVSAEFCLNASYRERFSEDVFKKQLEFKIYVQMLEFDSVYPSDVGHQIEELRKTNEVFNKSTLIHLRIILQIGRLEDVFAGRLNRESATSKRFFISRIANFSPEIANYLRSKDTSNAAPESNVERILNDIFNGRDGILNHTYLIQVYFEAQYLGLACLIILCRDCLLYRLSQHETSSSTNYECLLFDVLKAAVRVNDVYLFEKCAEKFYNSDYEHFDLGKNIENLKMNIYDRFVLLALEKRRKRIEVHHRLGIGAAETSRFLEFM